MEHVQEIHRGKAKTMATLLYQMTGLEHEQVALLMKMGGAYIGKKRCKDPDHMVQPGNMVTAWWQLPLTMTPVPFEEDWILHSDTALLIAAKPAGLPTQGRRDADYMAFYELLREKLGSYLALHHRLDQDTSGLMLFCREPKLNSDIAKVFNERRVEKGYLAYCQGSWPVEEQEMTVSAPIAPRKEASGTRQVVDPRGKDAETHLRLLASHGDKHLIICTPKTGRTHQIRVHLSHIGLPLPGDNLYGIKADDGFLLHCFSLAWPRCGFLRKGRWRLPIPATWGPRLPTELMEAYTHWWEEPC